MAQRVLIIGAAGRDFHNFNVYFRSNPAYQVLAFSAAQIPNIDGRAYPPELAGPQYPDGIPIISQRDLTAYIREKQIDLAVFSYSDVSHEYVMHIASEVMAAGADYLLLSPAHTWLETHVPVVAICATRTGAGKSQTSRYVAKVLQEMGKKPVVVRHPMPYGDLQRQIIQRFEIRDDLDRHQTTIEEREEYEHHLNAGFVVYAGVDYERILRQAEQEGDMIIWDGGNNDAPFFRPDLLIVVIDPLRAEHVEKYHPGELNIRMADIAVINKVDTADPASIEKTETIVKHLNPNAEIIKTASPITVDHSERILNKKVLVVEDGPTLTHGGMAFGAGWLAAKRYGAAKIIDPRPYAVGSLRNTFQAYPDLQEVLPAVGYGSEQMRELAETIDNTPCDLVLAATPIDLRMLISLRKPVLRVSYELQEAGGPSLKTHLMEFMDRIKKERQLEPAT